MNIGIYANGTRDVNFVVTDKLITLIKSYSINCAVYQNYNHNNAEVMPLKELVKFSDVMIVLGGDGTILKVITECAKGNVPVVGINMGHLGFMFEFKKDDLQDLLTILINKSYTIEKRALIEIESKNKYLALNDVVISKGENTRLINIEANVDNKLLDNYFCDGIIISTPTGSTAYSMSVGGPILAPDVEGFIINPISSHSLHSRPIVISNKSEVTLECSKLCKDCQLVVDGELKEKIKNNDKLRIRKSECTASFIRVKESNFYEVLLTKLNKWGVTESKE